MLDVILVHVSIAVSGFYAGYWGAYVVCHTCDWMLHCRRKRRIAAALDKRRDFNGQIAPEQVDEIFRELFGEEGTDTRK